MISIEKIQNNFYKPVVRIENTLHVAGMSTMLSCGKYHVRILPKNIIVNYIGIDNWIVHRVHEKTGDSYVWDTED